MRQANEAVAIVARVRREMYDYLDEFGEMPKRLCVESFEELYLVKALLRHRAETRGRVLVYDAFGRVLLFGLPLEVRA